MSTQTFTTIHFLPLCVYALRVHVFSQISLYLSLFLSRGTIGHGQTSYSERVGIHTDSGYPALALSLANVHKCQQHTHTILASYTTCCSRNAKEHKLSIENRQRDSLRISMHTRSFNELCTLLKRYALLHYTDNMNIS